MSLDHTLIDAIVHYTTKVVPVMRFKRNSKRCFHIYIRLSDDHLLHVGPYASESHASHQRKHVIKALYLLYPDSLLPHDSGFASEELRKDLRLPPIT